MLCFLHISRTLSLQPFAMISSHSFPSGFMKTINLYRYSDIAFGIKKIPRNGGFEKYSFFCIHVMLFVLGTYHFAKCAEQSVVLIGILRITYLHSLPKIWCIAATEYFINCVHLTLAYLSFFVCFLIDCWCSVAI